MARWFGAGKDSDNDAPQPGENPLAKWRGAGLGWLAMPRSASLVLSLLIASAAPAAAQAAVSNPPASLKEGQKLTVSDSAGGKRGRAVVRYYLSTDRKHDLGDLRLIGHRSARKGKGKAKLYVPYTAPAGPLYLVACAGQSCSASSKTTKVTVAQKDQTIPRTLGDQATFSDSDAIFLAQIGFIQQQCPAPSKGGPPSLKSAIAKAQARLNKAGGAAGVKAFKQSGASKNAENAETAASEALLAGEPGGALEALLAAHRLQPKEPAHLVNAAAVMAATGMPREALALLKAADKLEPRRSTPLGINVQAIALNAKGYALIQLGRFDEALPYLRAAVKLDPFFSEAKTNLGIALLCKKSGEGVRFARAGQYRFLGDAVIGEGGDPFKPPTDQIERLDLSGGKQATIPQFKLPRDPDEAALNRDEYIARQQEFLSRSQDRHNRIGELLGQQTPLNNASERRYLDLAGAIGTVDTRPDVAAVKKRLLDRQTEIGEYEAEFFDFLPGKPWFTWQRESQDACSNNPPEGYDQCYHREYFSRCRAPLQSAHGHWLGLMNAQLTDFAELQRLYYPIATGIAGNISDPGRQEVESLQIDDYVDGQFNTWISTYAGFWANLVRLTVCYEDPSNPVPPGPAKVETPHAEPCSDFLRGVKFAFKIGKDAKLGLPFDLSIEVNCEKISVEASGKVAGGDLGWIGAFGEVSYAPATGKVTVFGGPKAAGKIPGTSIGGSIKDGIYVTVGPDGVDDVGFRVSPTAQVGLDSFSVKGGKGLDFSFAPVFGVNR